MVLNGKPGELRVVSQAELDQKAGPIGVDGLHADAVSLKPITRLVSPEGKRPQHLYFPVRKGVEGQRSLRAPLATPAREGLGGGVAEVSTPAVHLPYRPDLLLRGGAFRHITPGPAPIARTTYCSSSCR